MKLKNFDVDRFLSNHWQKSACFISGAINDPVDFIEPQELAGLALEDQVESRIIQSTNDKWSIQHGPFDENDFTHLPESHWTLLVQTVEYWVPQTQSLLDLFRFVPRWRFDDLMVSYATDGGGVGPHSDNYDVFLIQTQGSRRWRVGVTGQLPESKTVIDGLNHLESFEPMIDVVMQPGDMLYVPPATAHWGESIGESMGYSIGFRAPQTRDLFALLADHLDCANENQFFSDRYRHSANYSNQIEPELLEWAQKEISNIANNQSLIADLLANSLSRSKLDSVDFVPSKLTRPVSQISEIKLVPGLNANWYLTDNNLHLNIEGESIVLPIQAELLIAPLLSGQTVDIKGLTLEQQKFDFFDTLTTLVNMGFFLVDY